MSNARFQSHRLALEFVIGTTLHLGSHAVCLRNARIVLLRHTVRKTRVTALRRQPSQYE